MMAVFQRLKQQNVPKILTIKELQENNGAQQANSGESSLRQQLRTKINLRRPAANPRPNPSAMFQANLMKERKKDQIRASGKIPGSFMTGSQSSPEMASKNANSNGNSKRPQLSARERLKSVLSRPQQVSVKEIQIISSFKYMPLSLNRSQLPEGRSPRSTTAPRSEPRSRTPRYGPS